MIFSAFENSLKKNLKFPQNDLKQLKERNKKLKKAKKKLKNLTQFSNLISNTVNAGIWMSICPR